MRETGGVRRETAGVRCEAAGVSCEGPPCWLDGVLGLFGKEELK